MSKSEGHKRLECIYFISIILGLLSYIKTNAMMKDGGRESGYCDKHRVKTLLPQKNSANRIS